MVEVKRYTNPTIRLSHTPGAGGSTVARRFAWTIKDEYPTLVLTNPKMDPVAAAARIDLLSKKSQRLPVVVIAEAATLPVTRGKSYTGCSRPAIVVPSWCT